jgi:hypothetical protein
MEKELRPGRKESIALLNKAYETLGASRPNETIRNHQLIGYLLVLSRINHGQ